MCYTPLCVSWRIDLGPCDGASQMRVHSILWFAQTDDVTYMVGHHIQTYKCECCNEMNYFHCHFAGQETTGNHLSFTLQQICRYPEVLKKWVVFAFGLERDDAKASCINGAIVKMEGLCVTVGRMIRRWNTFQSAPPPRNLYPPPSKT